MSQGMKYAVDIAFCIDSTGSMSPIIETVKQAALRFHDDLTAVMNEKSKAIDTLRVRVISFKDYWADGSKAMTESSFFTLPDDRENFSKCVKEIIADGGGDEPENGLEALAIAMRSDWSTTGDRRRQLLVVYTDASAHPLDKASKPAGYPVDLPKNLNDLTDLWEGQAAPVSKNAKRLILYAPDAEPWTHIANSWESTVHYASKAGEGLAEVDYKAILNAIANSV